MIPDPLCLSLDNDEPEKMVVQQEADTSEETEMYVDRFSNT